MKIKIMAMLSVLSQCTLNERKTGEQDRGEGISSEKKLYTVMGALRVAKASTNLRSRLINAALRKHHDGLRALR